MWLYVFREPARASVSRKIGYGFSQADAQTSPGIQADLNLPWNAKAVRADLAAAVHHSRQQEYSIE